MNAKKTQQHQLTIFCSYSPVPSVGDKIPGLGADEICPKSRSGGRKSGSLVRFIGEGIEGTGERDALDEALDEVGESGGSMNDIWNDSSNLYAADRTTKLPRI